MNVVLVVHIIFALTITLLECIYIGIYAPSINNTGYDDLNQFYAFFNISFKFSQSLGQIKVFIFFNFDLAPKYKILYLMTRF